MIGIWKVKAYIEYEIEAEDEKHAISLLGNCIFSDLDDDNTIEDIAEVSAEKIRDGGMEDSGDGEI